MELNTEEIAADEAAFEAAFANARGDEPPPALAPDPAPAPAPAPDGEQPPAPAPDGEQPPAPAPDAEPPRLIAGLTEEQLQAALARNATLQGTVDKMAGRLGTLMQQIETIRNTPQTPATQQALDLKLEKLSGSFPELAALLREDLAAAGTAAPAATAVPMVNGITTEELDARLASVTEKTNEVIEVKVLSIVHPDWLDVIKTPKFALWRDTVLPSGEGAKLMSSENAIEISQGLTSFKDWLKETAPPPPPPPPPPRANRLAAAVMPNGGPAPAPTPEMSEESAFAASFAAEQKRRGL